MCLASYYKTSQKQNVPSPPSLMQTDTHSLSRRMLDLAIIGSGPNALSLVSKILCSDRDQSTNFAFGFESKPHLSTKNVYRKLIGGKPRKDLLGKIKVRKTCIGIGNINMTIISPFFPPSYHAKRSKAP